MEDLCPDGRKILKIDFTEVGWNGLDWILQTEDRDNWLAAVNMIMNRQFL